MLRIAANLAVALSCLAVIALTVQSPASTVEDSTLVLPRPEVVRALARSHLSLIADLYWLKTVNRTTFATSAADGRALLALGNFIVELDPLHSHVYWLVGLNAPVPPPEGETVWPNSKEAADLMYRGVAITPLENKLTIALAHNLTFYQRDYVQAAAVLQERAKKPGAMPYFAALATRLLATSGQYEASRLVARAMLESATDDETRALYEQRLKLVDLEERLATIDAAAARYQADHGSAPQTVDDLVKAGYLAEAPACPFGGVIIFRNGRAQSTATKRLQLFESK